MHGKVAASIVLYKNDNAQVHGAVNSFLASYPEGIVFLVDNAPDAQSVRLFASDTRVRYIRNQKNIGFGAAHNVAIRHSQSLGIPFHLVLNPDVYFGTEVIPSLLDMMEQQPEVGLVMPKVLYPDGRIQHLCKLLPSPQNLLLRRFLPFQQVLFKGLSEEYELKFSGYDKMMDVPCLSGCFMLLRNDALRRVGLFDEDIFLYTEDVDLTRRMHQHFRTVFFPDVSIYHIHERGSYKKLLPFLFHVTSAITYFNKWGWFHDPERETINRMTLYRLSQTA